MEQRLNYHHLLYFWLVAREGGLAPASRALALSPQTLSGQIHALEIAVGHQLFGKAGRRLVLTEVGKLAYRYADEIFSLGNELRDVLARGALPSARRLEIGLVEVLPKMVVRRLLEPVIALEPRVSIVCREGRIAELAAGLAAHTLDVVLADEPLPPEVSVRAFNHLLGECGVTFFATPKLELRGRFPRVLDGAPMLMPASGTAVRRQLDAFFERRGVAPKLAGEFEDSALLKIFGAAGHGAFCAPTPVAAEVEQMYRVERIGATDEVTERFYAISVERRIKNPAIAVLSQIARAELFA